MPLRRHPFLYVDPFSGASGDMFLGALVDLGYPFSRLREDVSALGLPGLTLRRRRVTRAGLAATQVKVQAAGGQPHRGRREIRGLLRRARLEPEVRHRALEVFEALIQAEARIHRIAPDRVHLHEVGALDALADVVGTVSALHALGVEEIVAGPVNVGSGTVACEHGVLPVPAPATAALLSHAPIYAAGEGELTTPTGAALLRALVSEHAPLPPALVEAVGHGAGSREVPGRPNLLRLLAGRRAVAPDGAGRAGGTVEIRAQMDDADPRLLGHLMDRLLDDGALDVYFAPIQMKKNRPGVLVVILARREAAGALGRRLLDETPTLGYRVVAVERQERERRWEKVRTPYGSVRMKVADDDAGAPLATPEYEDCRRLAQARDIPLRRVLEAAAAAWSRRASPGATAAPRRKR